MNKNTLNFPWKRIKKDQAFLRMNISNKRGIYIEGFIYKNAKTNLFVWSIDFYGCLIQDGIQKPEKTFKKSLLKANIWIAKFIKKANKKHQRI